MTIQLYGIPNCDTVKKARRWLDAQGADYAFHDYKKVGADAGRLASWSDAVGFEALLNKRGTTWRQLPDDVKNGVDESRAVSLMAEHPTLIKRPVTVSEKKTAVGFKEQDYQAFFGK